MDMPFGSRGKLTLITSLSQSAVIAPFVFINGAMDGTAFATYARDVLIAEIKASASIVLDRFPIYCNTEAVTTLREHSFWFHYLPSYVPNLNPIAMAFSKLKAHLRRGSARSFIEGIDANTRV